MNSGRAFVAVAVLAVAVQGTEAGPRAEDTQYILFNREALANTLADPRCRYVCIFNWESIRTSDSIRNAITDLVEAGASTGRSLINSRESTPL
jgi:hypothetical protein